MGLDNPLVNTFSHWKKPAGSMPPDVHRRYSEHFFPGTGGHVSTEKIHEIYDGRYPDDIYGLRASLTRPILDKILVASPQISNDRLAMQLNADRYQLTGDLSSFTVNAISPQRVRIIRSSQEIPKENPSYIPPLLARTMKIADRIQALVDERVQCGEKIEEVVESLRDLALTNGFRIPVLEKKLPAKRTPRKLGVPKTVTFEAVPSEILAPKTATRTSSKLNQVMAVGNEDATLQSASPNKQLSSSPTIIVKVPSPLSHAGDSSEVSSPESNTSSGRRVKRRKGDQ